MYEIITFEKAFNGKSYYGIIRAIIDDDLPVINTQVKSLDFGITKCLNRNPIERLGSRELLEKLKVNN